MRSSSCSLWTQPSTRTITVYCPYRAASTSSLPRLLSISLLRFFLTMCLLMTTEYAKSLGATCCPNNAPGHRVLAPCTAN